MSRRLTKFMKLAIEEAGKSLRKGDCGFGAVIVKGSELIARARDTEKTDGNPTAHAELKAISMASDKLGRDLSSCTIISTHEPCPMCATAIAWAGITKIAYGYTISDSLEQGRTRINITLREIFERAEIKASIHEGILKQECSVLYNQSVRKEIKKLRGIDLKGLEKLAHELEQNRTKWLKRNSLSLEPGQDLLGTCYELFLKKFGITAQEAPIKRKNKKRLVIHSRNFCPTLEACKILGLDTRFVCKHYNERATEILFKKISPRITFTRNYSKLRPYSPYCEEMISITNQGKRD